MNFPKEKRITTQLYEMFREPHLKSLRAFSKWYENAYWEQHGDNP